MWRLVLHIGSLHCLFNVPLPSCGFSSLVNRLLCLDLLTVCLANFKASFCLLFSRGWSPSLRQDIVGSSLISENAATALCSTL